MSKPPRIPPYLASPPDPLVPLGSETPPTEPPEPKVCSIEPPEAASRIFLAIYLSDDLVRYAWRLAEISWERRGGFDEGLELPASSRAAAAGAITVANAAVEAAINESSGNLSSLIRHEGGDPAQARIVELLGGDRRSLEERLEGLAAIYGHVIDRGGDSVFQRFVLLVAVRNRLLHHKFETAPLDQGYWPTKSLRDLPIKLASPYRNRRDLHWFDHILTPPGVIRTIAGR